MLGNRCSSSLDVHVFDTMRVQKFTGVYLENEQIYTSKSFNTLIGTQIALVPYNCKARFTM